ncbi:MAG: alpha/beta hydrolase [Planctomycetota bacterium]
MRELTLPAPLMLLPGLGADAQVFAPQRAAFGDAVHVPDWIDPEDAGESLGRYAQRWAESVNAVVDGFDADRPWFLGGISMGGMIALELVPHLRRKPTAVLLMASARSTPNLPWYLDAIASAFGWLSPSAVARIVRWGAIPYGIRDGLDDGGYKLLLKMAKAADPLRLKWAIGAASEWTYPGPPDALDDGQPFPPVHQIHGQDDWLFPVREQDCDRVVENGRHVLNLSHATTINRWLFDHITAHCGVDNAGTPRVEDPDLTVRRRPEFASLY